MGNFRLSSVFNNFVTHVISGTILFSNLVPAKSCANAVNINLNVNDINFIRKIKNIYDKVKKCRHSLDQEKCFKLLFELHAEAENYTGKNIDLLNGLKEIENHLNKRGVSINSQQMKMIKSKLKKSDKKKKHKNRYFYFCEVNGLEFDQELCDLDFDIHNFLKHKKDEDTSSPWPVRVTIGLACCLCAYVLNWIPYCESAANCLFVFGIEQCAEGIIEQIQENTTISDAKKKKEMEEMEELRKDMEKQRRQEPRWVCN